MLCVTVIIEYIIETGDVALKNLANLLNPRLIVLNFFLSYFKST